MRLLSKVFVVAVLAGAGGAAGAGPAGAAPVVLTVDQARADELISSRAPTRRPSAASASTRPAAP